ncbi:DUF3592 domain-containing protein [Kitasatospora sp. NBC_00458]|uniref:DUF3592 domain-containing protein n=1 Tax=Kitasatospora sp. NBC_00458 TaxID=2903568 RepID=UPI002E18F3BB
MTIERRITGPRLLAVILMCCFAAGAGWLGTTGLLRVLASDPCGHETGCNPDTMALQLVGGLMLWLAAMLCVAGLVNSADENDRCRRMSAGLTFPLWFLLTLAGAYPADGTTHPWLLIPITVLALFALLVGVPAERRVARETAVHRRARLLNRRLVEHGATVPGTVTALAGTPATAAHRTGLRLTVRYRTLKGEDHEATRAGEFPSYALPQVGDRVTVRYDPLAPGDAEFAVRPPDEQPRDAASVLARELERLAVLHREGSLSSEEFALAKARLLTSVPEDGYSTASR